MTGPPARKGQYRALRDAVGVAPLPRDVVAVTGPDAVSFLQSLLSADLDAVHDGGGVHALLLGPRGKLDVDLRLLRVGDDTCLDCERGYGSQLVTSLTRFRIRVRAEIDPKPEWDAITVRGPEADAVVARAGGPVVPDEGHAHRPWGDAFAVRAPWPGAPGIDVVGPVATVASVREDLVGGGAVAVTAEMLDVLRLEAGVPRQGHELDGSTIPQEAFLERDAVSFTKGCFIGQELVCRIDSRGHVNRFLRGLRLAGELPPAGAKVMVDERVVGSVTSVAESPELGPVGLGFLRREVEPPAPVRIRWGEVDQAAEVVTLPLVP